MFSGWSKLKIAGNENLLGCIVFFWWLCLSCIEDCKHSEYSNWWTEIPQSVREHGRNSEKMTVWCVILSAVCQTHVTLKMKQWQKKIIVNYWTLTWETNQKNFLQMHNLSETVVHHTRFMALLHFRERKFCSKLDRKYGTENWPAPLPDLTLHDFFVLRYIKNREFKTPADNVTHLKRRIKGAIKSIMQEMITKVWKI